MFVYAIAEVFIKLKNTKDNQMKSLILLTTVFVTCFICSLILYGLLRIFFDKSIIVCFVSTVFGTFFGCFGLMFGGAMIQRKMLEKWRKNE